MAKRERSPLYLYTYIHMNISIPISISVYSTIKLQILAPLVFSLSWIRLLYLFIFNCQSLMNSRETVMFIHEIEFSQTNILGD